MSTNDCVRCGDSWCDRRSSEHGWLCERCFQDLVNSGPETNVAEWLKKPVISSSKIRAAEARFNVEFPKYGRVEDSY